MIEMFWFRNLEKYFMCLCSLSIGLFCIANASHDLQIWIEHIILEIVLLLAQLVGYQYMTINLHGHLIDKLNTCIKRVSKLLVEHPSKKYFSKNYLISTTNKSVCLFVC